MKHRRSTATLAFALALPAVAGTLTDASRLKNLQQGKTTAAQTVKLLGKPATENRSPDGRFAYMYEFDLANQVDPSKPHLQGVAALLFSKQGVFQGMQMFKKSDKPAAKKPAKKKPAK